MRLRLFWLALCLCFFSACGSHGSSTSGNLRFVQASPDAPLAAVYNDRTLVNGNVAYGNSTGYFSFQSGAHLRVYPASGSQPFFQATPSIASSANETLIMTGPAASLTSVLLTDGGTTPATGQIEVRVVNASQTIGTPDVYVVASGTSISAIPPTVSSLAFNSSAGYTQVPGGAYEIFITAAGTKNTVLHIGPIGLTSGNQTVVALDGRSGGFTFSLLTDQ